MVSEKLRNQTSERMTTTVIIRELILVTLTHYVTLNQFTATK